jgi:hypothetical protein
MRIAIALLSLLLALPAAAQTVINGSREVRGDLTVDGNIDWGTVETFGGGDTTPDVSGGVYWNTNSGVLTITDFDGTPSDGDILIVHSKAAITYDCTSSGLDCGSTDGVTADGDVTFWQYDGTNWDLVAFKDQSIDMWSAGGGSGDVTDVFDCASGDCATVVVESGDTLTVDPGGEIEGSQTVLSFNNDSGATLYACTAVYISGFDIPSDLPEADIADADAAAMPAVGLIESDVANGANGKIITGGLHDAWDTVTGEGWSVGDSLYVNDSGTSADDDCGNTLTNVRPANVGDGIQAVGRVGRVHATTGSIAVFGAGRTNDVPNLESAKIWVGSATNVATAVDMSVDATIAANGAVTVVDDSHNHVIANVDSMTSAALAGQISNETGTGVAVFSISPTIDNVLFVDDTGTLRLGEPDIAGTEYIEFVAPATIASNRTCTLVDGAAMIPDSCVGDGVDGGGGGTPPVKEYYWTAASLLPLEHAADSVAPLLKEEGTNVDLLVRAFDDTTDECVGGTLAAPSDITTTGSDTVTFRIRWYSGTATTGDAMFDIRWHEVGDNESWDGALTTEEAGAVTTAGTVDLITLDTWTETITNLGCAANDVIEFELCRDANSTGTGTDDLVGDAYVIDFAVEIIRE